MAGEQAGAQGDPLTATAVSVTGRDDGRLTLLDCLRAFLGFRSPRVLAAFLAAFLVARVAIGGWSWRDLAVAAALVALQPFTEWLIHVFLLHSKPRKLGPFTIDLPTARLHRWHHLNPTLLEAVLIPGSLIAGFLLPVMAVMWLLSWPLTLAGGDHLALWLTLMAVSTVLVGVYEWSHFIIHTPYRPKSRYYRTIWRSHRLHHFKNEHYWFGVSSDAADRVLGTSPDQSTVPKSETVKTLGVEAVSPAPYFASSQSRPTPTSTSSGGSSS
ncbi:MAG: sterol desaturase family protein [Solirubrobacterales bacterium]